LLLKSDLHFIFGKILHKREEFDLALAEYFNAVKINPQNFAAHFCLAKIHFLNGNFNAVDESLKLVLQNPRFKDSYESLRLLAKVKSLQGKRYEALALYKRVIELNPSDYEANFEVAQLFD
jgi:tetratricopeptide (TPR) repeat protein